MEGEDSTAANTFAGSSITSQLPALQKRDLTQRMFSSRATNRRRKHPYLFSQSDRAAVPAHRRFSCIGGTWRFRLRRSCELGPRRRDLNQAMRRGALKGWVVLFEVHIGRGNSCSCKGFFAILSGGPTHIPLHVSQAGTTRARAGVATS
jgi:hypothetical protein